MNEKKLLNNIKKERTKGMRKRRKKYFVMRTRKN